MAANFVPFGNTPPPTNDVSANEPLKWKVVSNANAKPLVNPEALPSGPPSPRPAIPQFTPKGGLTPCANTPKVTVQKDGDKVTQIRIQCTCGQVIELACQY